VRALRALGIRPAVWHLNEGHSAFLLAERARELIGTGVDAEAALASVGRNSVFTIHTPVSAGNERFEADLVRRLAGRSRRPTSPAARGRRRGRRGPRRAAARARARRRRRPGPVRHDRAVARLTNGANAVSQLRGDGERDVAERHLPRHPRHHERRHVPTWLGAPLRRAVRAVLDVDLDDLDGRSDVARFWERIDRIPAAELWAAHLRQKEELALFARGRLRAQFARHGEAPAALEELERVLDPTALTIGFARRFATYKRATLLFNDLDRLSRLVRDAERPVQIVFAGKAHPADRPGQQVIAQIFAMTKTERLRGRVFILEDYDMRIARFLVQGVDVWLNNPRRPLEASGTSGMKAAANGAVNVSVLDGWWDEGWKGDNGWAIGGRVTNPDEGAQDWAGYPTGSRDRGRAALLRARPGQLPRLDRHDARLDRARSGVLHDGAPGTERLYLQRGVAVAAPMAAGARPPVNEAG
jgi:starch phosphorylase